MNFLTKFKKIFIITKSVDSKKLLKGNDLISKEYFEKMRDDHLKIGQIFKKRLQEIFDKKIELKTLTEFRKSEDNLLNSNELVIGIGGDGTFLNINKKIATKTPTVLGINSNPKKSLGKLCGLKLLEHKSGDYDYNTNKSIDQMLKALDKGNYEEIIRRRLQVEKKQEISENLKFPLGKNII